MIAPDGVASRGGGGGLGVNKVVAWIFCIASRVCFVYSYYSRSWGTRRYLKDCKKQKHKHRYLDLVRTN